MLITHNKLLLEVYDNDIKNDTFLIPEDVKDIGYNCFENCLNLKKIIIPYTIENIYNFAFFNCKNLILQFLNPHFTIVKNWKM